jgi:hypothetical protein
MKTFLPRDIWIKESEGLKRYYCSLFTAQAHRILSLWAVKGPEEWHVIYHGKKERQKEE